MKVLIVDDDDFALEVLDDTLSRMGYACVRARDGNEALNVLRREEIRLVVTDWDMPNMNGVELCRAIRREELSGYIYVIMLTGREGAKQRLEGLCAGADDFLNKPLDPEELLVCLKTAERILSLETRDLALFALAKLAESRDPETGAHVERVQAFSKLLAQSLSQDLKSHHRIDEEYIRLLHQTSALHDLGKVGIPDAVLLKKGKLTPDEFGIMKTHTVLGAQTLEAALDRFPNARFLQMARDIAIAHHEKFNGSGYPRGLVGDQIPMCARIVALADVYDALVSRRVYKAAMSHDQAKSIILKDRGIHFDPEVVDAFLASEAQVVATAARYQDVEPVVATATQSIPQPPPGDPGVARPCKVLVVEDDPVVLERLVGLLSATGEQVFQATCGEDALTIVSEHRPRLIVSDWVMPGIDGVELCSRVRLTDQEEPVHFIMLTAHSEKARLLEAYKAGVDDFLSKPFDSEELLARVRAGLRAARLHDELVRKSSGSQALNAHLAKLNSRLERLSVTDELTGLFNRRHAMARLEEAWELSQRYARPLSIAMIDADHFKRINDTLGHDSGDAVLRKLSSVLREATRGSDLVCRVGGEEFLIIYPQQTLAEGLLVAERCRAATCAKPFPVNGNEVPVSISIGVATRTSSVAQYTDLLKIADDCLYAAKRGGRNVVITCEQLEKLNMANPSDNNIEIPAPGQPPINTETVMQRCGGDQKFADKIMDRFSTQAITELVKLEAAQAASDAENVRRIAHSLKSMTAYVAADNASKLARKIEDLGRENLLAEVPPALADLRKNLEEATAWVIEYRKNNNTRPVAA